MNRKILVVGSILAVVILITVSFTSVVGFQSNSITKAKNSPLFNIRTKNAINEKQDALTCEYVRKDKGFTIPIPTYDIRNALLQKLINRIRDLDRESLNKLKALSEKPIVANMQTEYGYNCRTHDLQCMRFAWLILLLMAPFIIILELICEKYQLKTFG